MKTISWTRVLALILALCEPAYADNFGVSGHVAAGQSTGATLSTGDLGASRSTTTGAVFLGGSSSSCRVDFGISTASIITFPCAITVNSSASVGTFKLGGATHSCTLDYNVTVSLSDTISCGLNVAGSIRAGYASGPSIATGDISASRSTTTGAVEIGGSSSDCTLDYGVSTGATLTDSCATTFAVAPTMSGANIANGTIPVAAIATGIPVGGSVANYVRINGVSGQTLTLSTLPTGNWILYATMITWGPSNSMQLNGTGATWEGTGSSNSLFIATSIMYSDLQGTATGGQTPSINATYTAGNFTPAGQNYVGSLTLVATRVS